MRFIHTSDWHLGRRLHSTDLTPFHSDFLDWLLDTAVAQQVDAVLVAGDVYDRAQPPAEAVALLDRTLARFARAEIPLIITSGNHDSAIRLNYGKKVVESAGIHLRTNVAHIAEPVVLTDESGTVGVYGIPYLNPDEVKDSLGAQRSHESVLGAAARMVADDAAARGLPRTVVLAHAFVAGGRVSDSERGIQVGGIGDAPAAVFDGFTYVALGHLHGPQQVALSESETIIHYSGSPLAFSFSERDHTKSVSLVELTGADVRVTRLPTPVGRPLEQVTGSLADLLARAGGDLAHLTDSFVKVVLTDPQRQESPMQRLRRHWPHVLELEFRPDTARVEIDSDLAGLRAEKDPAVIMSRFVHYVTGRQPDDAQTAIIGQAVDADLRKAVGA